MIHALLSRAITFETTSEVNNHHAKNQLICDVTFCRRVSLASLFCFDILFVRIINCNFIVVMISIVSLLTWREFDWWSHFEALELRSKSTTFICKNSWLTTWQISQLRSCLVSRYFASVFVSRRVVASVDLFASFDVVSSIDSASSSSLSRVILLSIDDDFAAFASSVAFVVSVIVFAIIFALVFATFVNDDAIDNIDMWSWNILKAKLTNVTQFDQRRWCVRCVRYFDRRSRILDTLRHLCMSLSDRQTKCDHCSHVEHRCSYDRASLQSQFLTRRATFRLLREMLNATKTMLMTTLVVWENSHFVTQIS